MKILLSILLVFVTLLSLAAMTLASEEVEEPADAAGGSVIEETGAEPAEEAEEAAAEAEPSEETETAPLEAEEPAEEPEAAVTEAPDWSGLTVDGASSAHGTVVMTGLEKRWTLENGVLLVTGSGDISGADEISLDSEQVPWYPYRNEIKAVILGEGITYAGYGAFRHHRALEIVRLPSTLISVREEAFYGCISLESIYIPDLADGGTTYPGFGSILKDSFKGCTSLTSIRLPSAHRQNWGSFTGCPEGITIYFPQGENGIPAETNFCNRPGTVGISFQVVDDADMPDTARVWIPAVSVTEDSDGITGFWLDNKNRMWDAQTGGKLLSWDDVLIPAPEKPEEPHVCGDHLTWKVEKDTETSGRVLTISGTGPMYDYTAGDPAPWDGEHGINRVVIEEGVTSIGEYAFSGCGHLAKAELPESLQSIGEGAFYRSGLKTVSVPDSVTELGKSAFSYCRSLTEAELGKGLKAVPASLFERCSELKKVTIPDSVAEIGEKAFAACWALERVAMGRGVRSIGSTAFSGCGALTAVDLPAGLTFIGDRAFEGAGLRSVTLPRTVTHLGERAFSGCEELESVTILYPLSLLSSEYEDWGNSAFLGCKALKTLYLAKEYKLVANSCFYNCNALTDVYYGGSEKDWYDPDREWDKMWIFDGNRPLERATIHYDWTGPVAVLGDVDGDGFVDEWDASLILQYAVGLLQDGGAYDLAWGDVDGDGVADDRDASLILQYAGGLIDKFPAAG